MAWKFRKLLRYEIAAMQQSHIDNQWNKKQKLTWNIRMIKQIIA